MTIVSQQPLQPLIHPSNLVRVMPSMHIATVAKKFDGYRLTLDKKRRAIFEHLLYELAGRREETLVNHPNHTEAVIMNILVEQEMRLQALEQKR